MGVLLLAMGVGVLIGRAGGAKTVTAPAQVISVASPGTGAATGTTPQAPGATATQPIGGAGSTSGAGSSAGNGSSGSGSSSGGSGGHSGGSAGGGTSGGSAKGSGKAPSSGSSSSGQSFEQKSRNLPNVVTTG